MITSAVRGTMPLVQNAPRGARGIAIHAHGLGHAHIPTGPPRSIFSRAQAIIQRNVPRLTRYLGMPKPMAEPVSLNRMPHRAAQTIQDRMSLSSRMALSRPLKAAGMPRPPMLPRPMHEVGLGTARKFSSQSAFRHVVENTSITTRAFWEANWDLNAAEERKIWVKREQMRKSAKSKRTTKSSKHAIIPVALVSSAHEEEKDDDDMSLYFAHPAEPSVTTFLQIALASTPSARMPFADANDALYLLPLRSLLDTHANFQARTQDVTAIFAHLDANNVWNRGVTVETWGDTAGLCVELRVKFSGWPEQDVRELLGGLIEVPGIAVQECLAPSVAESVITEEDEEDHASLFSPAVTHSQLEFVMPTASYDSEPITRSSSPSPPSSVSDVTFLDLSDGEISSGMATPRSAGSASEWGDSEPLSVFNSQPNTMLMSLSSAFLVRLQEEVGPFASPM
jgi:hypothetical protein